jgi:hypothetical protein
MFGRLIERCVGLTQQVVDALPQKLFRRQPCLLS